MYKIPANTLFIGQKLIFVPECQSTNTLLAELATASSLPEGSLVITSAQTAGRGQRGNVWLSSTGLNLTFSILLRPSFLAARQQFQLTLAASLALCKFLKSLGLNETKIKWPNDILVGTKKICGILIENSIQGERIQQSIVGIGLNINQIEFDVATATSLKLQINQSYDLNDVLHQLLPLIESAYLQLRSGNNNLLRNAYLQNLYGLNRLLPFETEGKRFDGIIEDIDEHGRLIIAHSSSRKAYEMKEVTFIL